MKRGPESKAILDAIIAVNKASKSKKIWKEVKKKLLNSKRRRRNINVSKISRYVAQGKTAVVTGKVLGMGTIDHKVDVVALNFSESAKQKIKKAGGKIILLSEVPAEGLRTELVLLG